MTRVRSHDPVGAGTVPRSRTICFASDDLRRGRAALAPVPALAHRPRRGNRALLCARAFAGEVQELAWKEPAAGRTPGRGQQRRGGAPGEEVRRCSSDRRQERGARLWNESQRRPDRGPQRQHHALPGDRPRLVPADRQRPHLADGVDPRPARRAVPHPRTARAPRHQHEPDRVAPRPRRAVAVRVLHRRRWPRGGIAAEGRAGRDRRLRRRRARAGVVSGGGAVMEPGLETAGASWAEGLAAPAVRELRAYDPGHDLVALRRRDAATGVIELGSNENPYGPSPRALEAATAALGEAHRYPDPLGGDLKRVLAAKHGVEAPQIVLGNGSHGLLMQLAQVFAGPGVDVVMTAFGLAVYASAGTAGGGNACFRPCDDQAPLGPTGPQYED